jgi:hypothetical protein
MRSCLKKINQRELLYTRLIKRVELFNLRALTSFRSLSRLKSFSQTFKFPSQ